MTNKYDKKVTLLTFHLGKNWWGGVLL